MTISKLSNNFRNQKPVVLFNSEYLHSPELRPVVRADIALHLEAPQDERMEDLDSVAVLFVIANGSSILRDLQLPKMDPLSSKI